MKFKHMLALWGSIAVFLITGIATTHIATALKAYWGAIGIAVAIALGLLLLFLWAMGMFSVFYRAQGSRLDYLERQAAILFEREKTEALKDARTSGANYKIEQNGTLAVIKTIPQQRGKTDIQIAAPDVPALPSPAEGIPEIVHYSAIAGLIPPGQALLGVHPEDGSVENTDIEAMKTTLFVGASSSGKTNTVYGKVYEFLDKLGAKLIVLDQHANKDDSLARKLAPFLDSFLLPLAVSDQECLAALAFFKQEFAARVAGAACTQKILLVVDECNRLNRNEAIRAALKEIAQICGQETRGYGMYGFFIAQQAVGLKWLRDSALTIFAHRIMALSDAKIITNDDTRLAKLVIGFKRGRTLVYGVDYDPMILQQPLYAIAPQQQPIVDSSLAIPSSVPQSFQPQQFTDTGTLQESALELDGTASEGVSFDRTFELKKLFSDIREMKKKGMSRAAILREFNLHASGRNNDDLGLVLDLLEESEG